VNVAALIAWLITALGGFYLLGKWLARGAVPAERHLPVPVVLAHGALAATTLVLVLLAALGA
jgi:hypothetical protein